MTGICPPEISGATTPEGYRSALQNLVAQHDDGSVPFVAFGYHPLWHGEVWRDDLNNWFGDTPVMIWHRSFHELIGNDASGNFWALPRKMPMQFRMGPVGNEDTSMNWA